MSPDHQWPQTEAYPPHFITNQPMRLRRAPWRVRAVLLVHVGPAAAFEEYYRELREHDGQEPGQVPVHFRLEEGLAETALGYLRWAGDAQSQREVTLAAAWLEALTGGRGPVLRDHLVRRLFQEAQALMGRLGLYWQGGQSRFVLPLNQDAQEPDFLAKLVASSHNIQQLKSGLGDWAEKRHRALARDYVLYYPQHLCPAPGAAPAF